MTIANRIARRLASLATAALLLLSASTVEAQTVIYYHTDALGSPVATTNAAGAVIERTEYEPYGQVLNGPVKDGPGYTGHVSDAQTGLSYMQQRYYDPLIGRFLSIDPVSADTKTAWNFNRYNYAANNPYKFKDPDGRIIDTIADVVFIGYDIYTLATDPSWTNAGALGADIVGAAVPFATGLGAGVRAAAHADEAIDAARVTSKELRSAGRADYDASKAKALTENGGKCNYCKADATQGDHVKSLKSFADDVNSGKMTKTDAVKQAHSPDNVVGACASCNPSKGAKELSSTPGPGKYVPKEPSERILEKLREQK